MPTPKSSASPIAGQPATDLVLDRLPNGEWTWLRPSTEPAEDDEARYWITWEGRCALRLAEIFGTEG